MPEFVDADGHFRAAGASEEIDTVEARVSRNGQQIADLSGAWAPVPTSAAAARYRLDLTTRRSSAEWRYATRTETAWQFTSARPAGAAATPLPLLRSTTRSPRPARGCAATARTGWD